MPSLLEHLEAGDAEPVVPPPPELLRSVKDEGRRRRVNRRRRNLGLVVALVAMLALPVAVLGGDDGDGQQEVAVTADEDAPPAELAPDLDTTPSSILEVPPPAPVDVVAPTLPAAPPTSAAPATTAAPTVTTAPTPTTAAATTATTKPPCRNSQEPSCGPFRWDPAPAANQPLTADFSSFPANPVAGAPLHFEVSWSDPDAQLTTHSFSTDGTAIGASCSMVPRYGPWTPPAATGGSGTLPFDTTFASPGPYRVIVSLGTGDCMSPYFSEKLLEREIIVTAA